jgi:hypothetical protein
LADEIQQRRAIHMTDETPGKGNVPALFDRARQGGEDDVRYRDTLARQRIEQDGRYFVLKAPTDADIISDVETYPIDAGLLRGKYDVALKDLAKLSALLFKFKYDHFKLAGRPGRDKMLTLLLNPFSHADLEEEDIENKFPEDRRIRSLIRALFFVIHDNQQSHIYSKRLWQLCGATIFALFSLLCFVGYYFVDVLMPAEYRMWSAPAWVLGYFVISMGVYLALKPIIGRELDTTTTLFKRANLVSSARMRASLTELYRRTSERLQQILDVLDRSTGDKDFTRNPAWPKPARRVFRIAMWEGMRLESIEKFRQLQFERLRVYYVQTERLGNLSSYAVWLAVALAATIIVLVVAAILGSWQWWAIAAIVVFVNFIVGARFAEGSRLPSRSFRMTDLVDECRFELWSKFKFYGRIADSYEAALTAIVREATTIVGGGGQPPPPPPRRRPSEEDADDQDDD